ncbi:hypothetical protein [Pseudomonas gingeri]|uniref:Uncharacterized protein n=1 Tax=Pseudomonas gingeri TaxID=117681 RepID=A0A7Y7YI27_9PSED|nr:hypothetical protein [Pseudomonas gingeri]NWA02907.1 hypothetical protein [Pseudomonas gingeri]NWA17070.1 hypothetical protein [Pseudomonas gingeri]NWA58521.1 hypothetical protein [Pseudomonas gingeri]NWA97915.1 hypothetical protein [Pseudomonas gingeri]NWB06001.1 hypothetical protein [Pseudomonas gingeri]
MVRIRGTIGEWPVDLTVELDDGDWARLGAQLQVEKPQEPATASRPVSQDDALWQLTRDLVRQAGQISGPELLEQLEGLTGSTAAAKRLLVRLRHCAEVKVLSGTDSPLYSWIEA